VKAVVHEAPRQVAVKDVPDARIERPTDVLVPITSANICSSDLHMYEGRTDFEPGRSRAPPRPVRPPAPCRHLMDA
jgi:glutathione-independent formaldehyde dehydrogenase